ncbi:DUF4327 family protein [cyanobacterium endosymbiont of Rhopalodia gibberula]|nr:DUF4327 family protein [cyanobacterium endosymbiont of Rhopalodia gibberula]
MLKIIQLNVRHSLNVIKKGTHQLIRERSLHRQQPIYDICNYVVDCR